MGVRTGLVGCLPGVWLALDTFLFGGSVGGPEWFQVGAGLLVVSVTVFGGVLGAKSGGWLATKLGHRPTAVAGN